MQANRFKRALNIFDRAADNIMFDTSWVLFASGKHNCQDSLVFLQLQHNASCAALIDDKNLHSITLQTSRHSPQVSC